MKKVIIIFILLLILLLNKPVKEDIPSKETRGIFISYIELSKYLKNKSIEESKTNINNMISNIKKTNINTIILQVRSNQDSIYLNSIFPHSDYINEKFDSLDYFIKESYDPQRYKEYLLDSYDLPRSTALSVFNNMYNSEVYGFNDNHKRIR